MTAMNLIVQKGARAAYLLTDTAAIYTCNGRVSSFASKVLPVVVDGVAVAAVAISGRWEPHDIAEPLGKLSPRSLKDFLQRFPDCFCTVEETIKSRDEAGSMSAVVAAFNHERNLPQGFAIANDNVLFPPDHHPYALRRIEQHITEFDPDDAALRCIDFRDPRQWVPERDAGDLIEAQRRDPDIRLGRYSIGGQAVLTRLDGQGLTNTVVKTWPDRVGRRIDPKSRGWRERLGAWSRG